MAQSYGNTWWGSHWLKSLSHIDYENRIPRGATYARKGNVKEIQIQDNIITAKVAGSRPRPYKVTITVPPFSSEQIDSLMEDLIAHPALISKLLNRELDPEILTIAERCGLKIFPSQWNDLKMSCDCPDWAVPCKHLAAVVYMVSREIDSNPFLVFEMHNAHLLDELKKRGIEIEVKTNMEIPALSDLFIQKTTKDLSDTLPDFRKIDFACLQDIAGPLISLLPANPAFYNEGDFQRKYEAELLRVTRNAKRIFGKNSSLETFFLQNKAPEPLSHHSELSIEVDELMTWMFYHGGCSVKERQEMVERFQNNRADKVFLLSLKAAGTGLNLTAASHVIHYDLWWNPAVEAQATDRAYRIGQHKNVMVHRFITKNTFEERIDEMIQRKKNLADLTVTSGESWIGKLSNKELKEIFGN